MTLRDIIINLKRIFQKKIKNQIQLGNDSNLESNLKFLKVSDKSTPIQISEDTVNIQGSLNVNGSAVQTGTDAGATELDGLSDVTYSSGDLTIDSLDTIISGNLTIDSSGDIRLDAAGNQIFIDKAGSNFGQISTSTGSTLAIVTTTNYTLLLRSLGTGDITLDSSGDVILDSGDGNFIAKKAGTEFSSPNSAYAGMILGYTCVGANAADDLYALTTSYVCFLDSGGGAISIGFKTPPSEFVEIEVELYFSAGSGASDLFLSLSDNAAYAGNSLTNPLQFEKVVITPSRGWGGTITQKFFIQANNLEAVGADNRLYIAAKTDSTSGTPVIKWSGDASGDYTNLVMKATALPETIIVGS